MTHRIKPVRRFAPTRARLRSRPANGLPCRSPSCVTLIFAHIFSMPQRRAYQLSRSKASCLWLTATVVSNNHSSASTSGGGLISCANTAHTPTGTRWRLRCGGWSVTLALLTARVAWRAERFSLGGSGSGARCRRAQSELSQQGRMGRLGAAGGSSEGADRQAAPDQSDRAHCSRTAAKRRDAQEPANPGAGRRRSFVYLSRPRVLVRKPNLHLALGQRDR